MLSDPLLFSLPLVPSTPEARKASVLAAGVLFSMAPSSVLKVKGSRDNGYGRLTTKTPVEVESV